MSKYTTKTPTAEPVEIRFRKSGTHRLPLVLTGAVHANGCVGITVTYGGAGIAQALSNLQITLPVPVKAVAGWQAELVQAAASGLYTIDEVR